MIAGLPERVAAKIWPLTDCSCWLYDAKWHDGKDYSKAEIDGIAWFVHRYLYTMAIGPIPAGLVLDHLCRQHWCINPWHLEPVTVLVNTRRGDATLYRRFAQYHAWPEHRRPRRAPIGDRYAPFQTKQSQPRRCSSFFCICAQDQADQHSPAELSDVPCPFRVR